MAFATCRSAGLREPAGRPAGNGAQESPEPLGSVHFNALYGEARLSESPLRKPPFDHSTLSKLRHLPDGTADAKSTHRLDSPAQKLPIDLSALSKARHRPADTSEAAKNGLAQSADSDGVLNHEARIRGVCARRGRGAESREQAACEQQSGGAAGDLQRACAQEARDAHTGHRRALAWALPRLLERLLHALERSLGLGAACLQ